MSQTVTMYTSEDSGAPQLTTQKPSEIIDILTKCLVDGYGSKSPLGWTRPYYDGAVQSVVFRNNVAAGGSGGYAKFYSELLTDTSGGVMRLTHAASMTDINSFFNRGFTQAFRAQQDLFTPASNRNKWVLVGTALAFYFFINMNVSTLAGGNNEQPTVFVGDFYSSLANDAGRFISLVNPSVTDSSVASPVTTPILTTGQVSPATACLKIYDADGNTQSNNYAADSRCPKVEFTPQTGFNIDITTEHILYPLMVVRQNYDIDASTVDRLGVLAHNSNVSPSTRGTFPGIGLSVKPGFQAFSWPVIREINTHDHLLFRSHQSGPCNMWLNIEVWNDPFGNV